MARGRKAALLCAAMTLLGGTSAFQGGGSLPSLRKARGGWGPGGVRMQAAGGVKGKLLVLGGTGFVGSTVTKLALDRGYEVVSLSRRGQPAADSSLAGKSQVTWVQGDATKPEDVQRVVADGGFTGIVHAIGMLFEGDLNKFASGSGSIPSEGSTYDDITRQTAFNAIDAAVSSGIKNFGFVSAAEARWDFDDKFVNTPVEWLHRYVHTNVCVSAGVRVNVHTSVWMREPTRLQQTCVRLLMSLLPRTERCLLSVICR